MFFRSSSAGAAPEYVFTHSIVSLFNGFIPQGWEGELGTLVRES